MGENRHLNVVDRAAVFLGKPCHLIDDGLVVAVENILLPTHLRIVHLGLHGTNRVEIFFADVAKRKTASHTAVKPLRHARNKADVGQRIAAVDTDGEVAAVVADLGLHL